MLPGVVRRKNMELKFCEECGSKLVPNTFFCENCGTKIGADVVFCTKQEAFVTTKTQLTIFTHDNWACKMPQKQQNKMVATGIILTKCKFLAEQLKIELNALYEVIADYIQKASLRNIVYYLLDLENNVISSECTSVEDNIQVLKEIASVYNIDYLFILGNEEIIEVAEYENLTSDCDLNIYSDLPYVRLSTSSQDE